MLAGFSDPAIYDSLEAKLIASLPKANDKNTIDYSAWLVKGWAYSGNDRYSFKKVAYQSTLSLVPL